MTTAPPTDSDNPSRPVVYVHEGDDRDAHPEQDDIDRLFAEIPRRRHRATSAGGRGRVSARSGAHAG
jgi:hypothetical protein